MVAPINEFKRTLQEGRPQIGLWQALANPYTTELCSGAGYDWLLLDAEHAPNDIPLLVSQLQAMKAYATHPVVRPPVGEAWIIKQLLDIGAQTLLVPMVESREQAEQLVKAIRYPPAGIRGVGAALARASNFGRTPNYLKTADDEICLLVQIENRLGLDALDDIARVDGVDGVFIGPADLAADLGYIGQPTAPEVQEVVVASLKRIVQLGKPAGILIGDLELARQYVGLGASFVAIGNDVGLLANATAQRLGDFKTLLSQ